MPKNNGVKELFDVSNKVVVVTGGASGIGRGVAEKFAALNAKIFIVDIDDVAANAATQQIKNQGGKATFICADVSNPKHIKKAISKVVKVHGGIDVLVNSAAPSRKNRGASNLSQEAFTMEHWDYEMNVLVKAQANISREALPHLIKSQGSIVNFGSTAGALITHQTCAYHSGKAAIEQLTRYLAFEFGGSGVRVNAICPGIVERAVGPSITDDPENREIIRQVIPLQRAASAGDIANVVIFLSSNAGSYITGQSIVTDGGLSMGEQFGVARKIMTGNESKREGRGSRTSPEGDGK